MLNAALQFEDGASPNEVYDEGNVYPATELDRGTAATPFARLDDVAVVPQDQIIDKVIPYIGHPFRTQEEDEVIAEIITTLQSEQ